MKLLGLWLTIIGVGVLALRSPMALFYPDFALDDGWLFQQSYNNTSLMSFYYMTGLHYISALPQLIAHVGVRYFPISWVPYLFTFSSVILLAMVFALPLHKGFAAWGDVRARAVLVLLFVLLPAGSFALSTMAVFQNWTCLLALILLLFIAYPAQWCMRIMVSLTMLLCIWSHPLSVVILPYTLYQCWQVRDRAERGHYAVLSGAALLYVFFGVQHGASVISGEYISALWVSVRYVLERVVMETLLSYNLRIALREAGLVWAPALLGAVLSAGIGWLWVKQQRPRTVLWLVYFIFVLSGLAVFSRYSGMESAFWERAFRYNYVQKYLLVVALFHLLQPIILWRYAMGVVAYALVLAVTHLTQYQDWAVSPQMAQQQPVQGNSATEAARLREFLQQLQQAEHDPAQAGTTLTLTRPQGDLVVKVRHK